MAALLIATVGVAETPEQAATRFARLFLPYAPGSVVEVSELTKGFVGPYLPLTAIRTNIKPDVKEQLNLLVDPAANTVVAGLVFSLPATEPAATAQTLPLFAQQVLPELLGKYFGSRVKVRWPTSPIKLGAVIPLTADVSTGYGTFQLPIALTADARYLGIGATWSLDRDPRAVRREILADAEVQWDVGHGGATVKVVEFSDFQCPGCKKGWGSVKPILTGFGEKVRHGIVTFPLVSIHPWAFRAAVAGYCVGQFWPDHVVDLKEECYRLQDTLSVESLDDIVFGFLATHALSKEKFLGCYLKDPSVEAVLHNLALGYRLGVLGTPTFFAGGEPLPWMEPEWFTKRLQAIVAAGNPEGAAEIVVSTPTPTPKPTAARTTAVPEASPSTPPKQ